LNLDFVALARFRVLQEKIEATGSWLRAFPILEDEVSQPEE
jgi:hypothetical protein